MTQPRLEVGQQQVGPLVEARVDEVEDVGGALGYNTIDIFFLPESVTEPKVVAKPDSSHSLRHVEICSTPNLMKVGRS